MITNKIEYSAPCFGTDGIRGKFGSYPITEDFFSVVASAFAQFIKQDVKTPKFLIAKDTRESCDILEKALIAGLVSHGVEVHLVGVIPTPGASYLINKRFDAGIVITASHNQHTDNGLKFFNAKGQKLSPSEERRIQNYIDTKDNSSEAYDAPGTVIYAWKLRAKYYEYCKTTVSKGLWLAKIKVVIDCANGSGWQMLQQILKDLGATVIKIGCSPNGTNINDRVGSTHPNKLQTSVVQHKAHIGIALDGDADRVILIDRNGGIINGDGILYILSQANMHQDASIVSTKMSNIGFEKSLEALGIRLVRTDVGDKFVEEALQKNNWHLGGEPSGHIIIRKFGNTGDGIITALQVLQVMRKTKKSLIQLLENCCYFPQILNNLPLKRALLDKHFLKIAKVTMAVQDQLGDRGRILVRPSGTENLLRVMSECKDVALTESTQKDLLAKLSEVLG